MAWEISHTPQAWTNVRARLIREWSVANMVEALSDATGERDLDKLASLPADILADACIDAIREHNTCDTGGHYFWIDRDGWHTVSCSAPSIGYCGACKCDVKLVREIPGKGAVELSCGCEVIEEIWAAEE